MVTIFLGAGASKIFGLPTLQELTKDLIGLMESMGFKEIILEIIEAMERYGITPDFENIYSTIESLSNPLYSIKKTNGFVAYFVHKANYDIATNLFPESQNILSNMRGLIYEKCKIPKFTENHGEIFDKLFKACDSIEYRDFKDKRKEVQVSDTIVTTNYDVATELYHKLRRIPLTTGFKETNSYWDPLDPQEYYRKIMGHWLIKLHGSLWHFKKKNGDIIQTVSYPESLSDIDFSIKENLIIYPVGEKPILQHPYFTFYKLFQEQPWNTLVVIGYSFRDDPVNLAIIERLKSSFPPKKKLIVVNRDVNKALKNLGSIGDELDKFIIKINAPFENNDSLFEDIHEKVRTEISKN